VIRPLLVVLVLSGVAHAAVTVTTEEQALLGRLDRDELIKARTEAEAILARDPNSFVATWAMARVHHDEEGNHARALFYVRRAEELLTNRLGGDPTWHKKVLLEEYDIVFEMNRNEEALRVLDRYDALYGPGNQELRIWPLFKLGRPDEARAIATKLAGSDDWDDRARGYNGMLSIEFEAHDREAAYRWAVEGVRGTQERSCTILRNAAGVAYTRFRLGEAEDFARRADGAEVNDCTNAGYDQLAGLYIVEGEFQKAIAAIDQLKKEHVPKRFRPHYALMRRQILVDLLAALGKVEDGERMAGELYSLPPRTGMISTAVEVERFARSFRYWAALDNRLIQLREKRSYGPRIPDLPDDEVRVALQRWEIRRALIQLAARPDTLVNLVRPNLGDLNDFTPWRAGGLIDVLGSGVVRLAVAEARRRDAEYPEAAAYLDALEGEIDFREGRLDPAVRLAASALAGLPPEEALLRGRTLAWQADALRRLGNAEASRAAYQTVLRNYPSLLRILDVKVPARIVRDETPLARRVADRLAGSSRFVISGSAPFTLDVGDDQICLLDGGGAQLACGAPEKEAAKKDPVGALLDAFHSAAFSPRVSLTQADLQSLDGSPVRVGADQVLKGVLEP